MMIKLITKTLTTGKKYILGQIFLFNDITEISFFVSIFNFVGRTSTNLNENTTLKIILDENKTSEFLINISSEFLCITRVALNYLLPFSTSYLRRFQQ